MAQTDHLNPEADQGSEVRIGLILFAAAALARLVPVLLTRQLGIGLDDMFQYDMLARSLAAGDGFRWYAPSDLARLTDVLNHVADLDLTEFASVSDPRGIRTSFRAPLYPGFLSLIYHSVELSDRFFAARIVQSFLLATLAPLTYGIARELKAKQRWAIVAGVFIAAWPLLVSLPLALATENLFLPLVAAATLLLLKNERRNSKVMSLAAGFILALAALTRSVIIGFPMLLMAWYWWRGRRSSALLMLLPMILLITPWVLRNSLLHGHLTMIETSLGYNLYLGYHPGNTGTFKFGPSLDLITIIDDYQRDQTGRQLAWEFIQQDPWRVPKLMVWKLAHFWGLEDRAFSYLYSNNLLGQWPPIMVGGALVITSLPLVLTLPAAVLGWSLTSRDRQWQLISLLFAWYIGVHVLIMAEERFHFALLPMLAGLAARGLSQRRRLWQQIRQGDPVLRRRMLLAALLIALLVLNWGLEIDRSFDRYQMLIQPGGWNSGLHY